MGPGAGVWGSHMQTKSLTWLCKKAKGQCWGEGRGSKRNPGGLKRALPRLEEVSTVAWSPEKRVAAGCLGSFFYIRGRYLSEVRAHLFTLKHVTSLSKLSEGFSPPESTGAGARGWRPDLGPIASLSGLVCSAHPAGFHLKQGSHSHLTCGSVGGSRGRYMKALNQD